MKVLVTGATGFIGKRLCQVLDSRGHEVIQVARHRITNADVTVGDIGPATDWQAAFAFCPDTVVHLAARVHVMHETIADPLTAFRNTNVEGTLNLARQAATVGVRRFVYLSSIKVNGEMSLLNRPFKADDCPAPQDAYAISKYEAEMGLIKLAQTTGLEVVIIRPPLVYGPEVKGNFASLLSWIRRGFPMPFGAVHNLRSLIALENLVDFIVLCADREKSSAAANEIFLVCDGEPVSITELLKKAASAYGLTAFLVPVPMGMLKLMAKIMGRSAEMDRLLGSLVVDSKKALDMLGWHPVITMDDQLRMMANHDAENS